MAEQTNAPATLAEKFDEFVSGWPLVSAAALGIGLGMSPLPFYTLAVFAGPVGAELNWTTAQVMSAIPIYAIIAVIVSPVIGWLADLFGARRICLISITLFGLSLMAHSLHNGNLWIWGIQWGVMSIVGAGTLPITFTRALNNAFYKHRGKALGIALITTGIFGTLSIYFVQEMITMFNWRIAYVALGALPILIALPLSVLSLRDVTDDVPAKESKLTKWKYLLLVPAIVGFAALAWLNIQFISKGAGRLETVTVYIFLGVVSLPLLGFLFGRIDTDPIVKIGKETKKVVLTGLTVLQSFAQWRLYLLFFCILLVSYSVGAIIPNLKEFLVAAGFSDHQAVALAGMFGLAVLVGRLVGGYLVDRFWAPGVAFVFLVIPVYAYYLLSATELSAGPARWAILMIGVGAGVEYDFLAYLVSKYFGMLNYSTIYGSIYAFFAIGAGLGAILMPNLAAQFGWSAVMLSAGLVLLIGTIPLLALGRYREFPPPQESTPVESTQ